jgi:hypothetical protein
MSGRVLLAAPRSFCAGVAHLRLTPVGETRFPLRDPFFTSRLGPRAAEIASWAEENTRGNLTVPPDAPSLARAREGGS